ncbi:uncharacterized protein K452DRAFT_288221 [Aplosporella prunicola CBS 121167]|uniref:ATP-grasp fold RimK-type domain-containing protein n=1 Tax=Aplosporella prunicola CBS 121167 TaxID=1176127 RepID=A0A6A6BBN7_9PEZI|nr:uncharacterized protein K452DRAFT_288221 [Aplosporella prunicola CBS 121167]KAF2141530.1 hypothetical protein K452DRAFT_288221 [Aplosporella prunicola CBS 121167]
MDTITPSLLFVTANLPTPESEAHNYICKMEDYLKDILKTLRHRGASVALRSFQDLGLTPEYIASTYSHILFLAVDDYIRHMPAFTTFLTSTLPAAQHLSPTLRVYNPSALVAWNSNKTYLAELQALSSSGFHVPRTTFLPLSTTDLFGLASHLASDPYVAAAPAIPVVLKPSVAASGYATHLVRTPLALTPADADALAAMHSSAAPDAALLVQEYLPRIAASDGSGGEWSMIVVDGRLTHAVRKRPRDDEFRINSAFGGVWEPMAADDERVPESGRLVAEKLWVWLLEKEKSLKKETGFKEDGHDELMYARVDGVVSESGEFVLMEVELIEPWLWMLDEGPGKIGLEALCDAIMGHAK